MTSKLLASLAALSLVAAPVAAEAQTRTASPTSDHEQIAGTGTLGLLLGLAILGGIVALVGKGSDGSSGLPTSP